MADDQRKPTEAKRLMDETLRRMLATPPDPHVAQKKKPQTARKKK
jgi:hypothetical protein